MKKWEVVLITLAILALISGGAAYLTEFPIGKYLLGWSESESGKQIATLTRAVTGVRRQKVGDSDFQGVAGGAPLFNEDTIVTPPDGTARIEFTDGSFIEMAESTMVKLSFGSDFSLGGITRSTSVQILTGNVTGQVGSEVAVKSGDQKIAIAPPKPSPKPSPKPILVPPPPSPSPLPSFSPSPSPSPSPSVSPPPKVAVIYPKDGSLLSVPKGSQVPELPLTFVWELNVNAPAVDFKLLSRSPKVVVIFKKTVALSALQGKLPLTIKNPGNYRWEISLPQSPETPLAKANFTVAREYEGMVLNGATVGGTKATSSQLTGKVLNNFDLTFSWQPYPNIKAYDFSFFLHANGKSIWSRQVEGTFYTMNEGKVFAGHIFYQVAARTSNGFLVKSPMLEFEFQFTPPIPMLPRDGTEFSKKKLLKEDNQILLTWTKTNFTSAYQVQIATDPAFQNGVTTQQTTENFYVMKDPAEGTYYWRAQSFAGTRTSGPSGVLKFTVQP